MSLPKDYDKNNRKSSSPHIKGQGFAYVVVVMVVIGVIATAGAVAWMSSDNSRTSANNDFVRSINEGYLNCETKIQKEACMRDIDAIYNKNCKVFDAC